MQEESDRGKRRVRRPSVTLHGIAGIGFQIGVGDLVALKKTKGLSRPDDQSGGLLWMVSGPLHALDISPIHHGTDPDLLK